MTEEEGKARLREALSQIGWVAEAEEPQVNVIMRPEPRKYQWSYIPVTHLSILLTPASAPSMPAEELPFFIRTLLRRDPLEEPALHYDRDETTGELMHLAIDLTYRCPRENLFSRIDSSSDKSE